MTPVLPRTRSSSSPNDNGRRVAEPQLRRCSIGKRVGLGKAGIAYPRSCAGRVRSCGTGHAASWHLEGFTATHSGGRQGATAGRLCARRYRSAAHRQGRCGAVGAHSVLAQQLGPRRANGDLNWSSTGNRVSSSTCAQTPASATTGPTPARTMRGDCERCSMPGWRDVDAEKNVRAPNRPRNESHK